MLQLRARLELLSSLLKTNQDLWDIGCDHGLLGEKFLAQSSIGKVYLLDKIPHLINRLGKIHINEARVSCILHNAKQALTQSLSGNVVLAGMGADTIIDILDAQTILPGSQLILNPFKDEQRLQELPYELVNVHEVKEGRRLRKIFEYFT